MIVSVLVATVCDTCKHACIVVVLHHEALAMFTCDSCSHERTPTEKMRRCGSKKFSFFLHKKSAWSGERDFVDEIPGPGAVWTIPLSPHQAVY